MTGKELKKIYNEAYKAVYWTAMSLLRNEADAEDIVQDTFVSFIESYSDLTDTAKTTALLKKIAANKCLDRIKLAKTDNMDEEFFDNVEAVPEDFLPDSIVESDEMRRIVMDIINNSLSEDVRRTLILFYFDEMSTKEIAEALGVPQGTVLRRLNYARNKIKKEVEKYEEENDTKLFGMAIPFLSKLFIKESEQVVFKPLPASLSNLSASVKSPSDGAGIKASAEAVKKGTDIMKTKILIGSIACVAAIGATIGIIAGVMGKKAKKAVNTTGEYSTPDDVYSDFSSVEATANKDYFVWRDTKIDGFSEYGKKQTDIVIPAECDGITGVLNDGTVVNATFESDNDIDFGAAFSNSTTLKTIVLPKNQKTLLFSAFQSCTALETAVLPEDVTELPMSLFLGDTNLKNVTIGGSVEKINMMCFCDCSSLETLKLPASLKFIDYYAFRRCTSLSSIELPEGVTTINDAAFEGCTSLTSIKLPSSLKEAGLNLFYKSAVADIYVPADMVLTEWDSTSFYNNKTNVTVHVTAGSWADQHFDEVFEGAVKSYN